MGKKTLCVLAATFFERRKFKGSKKKKNLMVQLTRLKLTFVDIPTHIGEKKNMLKIIKKF